MIKHKKGLALALSVPRTEKGEQLNSVHLRFFNNNNNNKPVLREDPTPRVQGMAEVPTKLEGGLGSQGTVGVPSGAPLSRGPQFFKRRGRGHEGGEPPSRYSPL